MSKRADRLAKKPEESRLSCKAVECNSGRHSYSPAPKRAADRRKLLESVGMETSSAIATPHANDRCWACGDESIDWNRTRARNPESIDETLNFLRKEFIRDVYWQRPFDDVARQAAFTAGYERVRAQVTHRLATTIKKPRRSRFDDIITPWEGHSVIHYAQHATATCCRRCFEQWYGVPAESRELTDEELRFAELLILEYLARRHDDIWGTETT